MREQINYRAIKPQPLSAEQCLADLIANYPFEDSQRNLIILKPNENFEFNYPVLFIEASLRHLLTVVLKHITMLGRGEVQIWVSNEHDYHVFNVKDTSHGLEDSELACLFDHFLFEHHDKTRPGLGFCRLALLHMGGDIICDAANGEWTHFKVMLPKQK